MIYKLNNMNWKLILSLSLFGLAMALGTVFFIPPRIEPVCWLIIFLVCAWQVAKNVEDRFFLHGFLVSMFNCIWITGFHIIFSAEYVARHAEESKQYVKMSAQMGLSLTQSMLIMGPVIGIISGLILGLMALIASKFA